jgi:hypothetical protein
MDDHGTGIVVEFRPADAFEYPLQKRGVLAPDERLEDRVGEGNEDCPCGHLGPEFGPFGDPSGDDGGDARGEAEKEEVMNQVISLVSSEDRVRGFQEGDAVGDGEADKQVGDSGNRPVGNNLDKGVDLILHPDRSHLEKGETGVHGEYHDRAQHEKEHVGTVLQICHR